MYTLLIAFADDNDFTSLSHSDSEVLSSTGYDDDSDSGSAVSGGSIFLIIFFSAACIYFIGGFIARLILTRNRGCSACPNYEFWSDLPQLVTDGVHFSLMKIAAVFNRVGSICGGDDGAPLQAETYKYVNGADSAAANGDIDDDDNDNANHQNGHSYGTHTSALTSSG